MGVVKYGAQDEAKELAYDNTNTGLAATTIQQAIDLLYSTKEPANSNILKTPHIGVSVQAYNSNLTGINQGLSTTSDPTFRDLILNSLNVNNNLSISSLGEITGSAFTTGVSSIASELITVHEGLSNPHPNYLTQAEADALYATIAHAHATGNLLTVSKTPAPNEYSSITAALAAATSPSSSNRYVIRVLPGEYTEVPFTIPAYVYVTGLDPWNSAVIKTSDLTNDFITIAPNGGLFNIAVSGPTTSGKSAMIQTASGTTKIYWVNIKEGYYGITLAPTSGAARCHVIGVVTDGPTGMNRMFNCDNPVGVGIFILMQSGPMVTTWTGSSPAVVYLNSDGGSVPKANATLDMCQFRGNAPSGQTLYDVYADNGAVVRGIACSFAGATSLTNTRIAICSGPNAGGTAKTKIDVHGSQIKPGGYTKDIKIMAAGSINSYSGTATEANLDFVTGASFNGSFADSSFGQVIYGELYVGNKDVKTPLNAYVEADKNTGLVSGGGCLRGAGAREVTVQAGIAFIDTVNGIKRVTWNETTVTVNANTHEAEIYVNSSGVVGVSYTPVDYTLNCVLAEVGTNATSILFLFEEPLILPQFRPKLHTYLENVIGPVNVSGGIVTENATDLHLDVTESTYHISEESIVTASGTNITFTYWYRNGSGDWVAVTGQNTIDTAYYDNGSGTLASITAGKYKRDAIYVASNTGETEYHVIYGQELFDSVVLATNNPIAPEAIQKHACRLAGIIVLQDGTSISSIVDQRPKLGQSASGSTGITQHNDMLGRDSLTAHSQYQLGSEKGNANGYASLDGTGKVPLAQVPTIAHGDQAGGTLHANASTSVAGFMSSTDKTKLDGIANGATAYNDEQAQDAVAAAIAAGTHTGITVGYNDVSNTFTFNAVGSVKSIYGSTIASSSGTSQITPSVSAPTTSQGTQLWSQAITPASTESTISIQGSFTVSGSNNAAIITIAVFRDSTFIGATMTRMATNNDTDCLTYNIVDIPATTSEVTYSCRVGTSNGTWYVNRRTGENTYGGTKSGWSIVEF